MGEPTCPKHGVMNGRAYQNGNLIESWCLVCRHKVTDADRLRTENEHLRAALVHIRDLDYRGNRHHSADIATQALARENADV